MFLITEKASQRKFLHLFEEEKDVYVSYPPRQYFIELLEKVSDPSRIEVCIEKYKKTYNCEVKSLNPTKRKRKPGERRPRPKGLTYNLTEEDIERRKKQFDKENHPNVRKGFSEEHRRKLSEAKKGKPSNHTGKKHKLEYKILMSMKLKGNKNSTGFEITHNPLTGDLKWIREGEKLPDGYRYGKGKAVADNFNK